MADLVSLQDAQRQLRWADSDVSLKTEELQGLIDQATAIVLACCNTTDYWRAITPTWDEDTAPWTVKTAILKQVAYLNQYRGDEQKGTEEDDGIAPGVKSLLWFTRDPVIV
jgi:hypothetical protein